MADRQPEAPDGFGAGILFLLVILLSVVVGVAQLVHAKQYGILGLVIALIAGLSIIFAVKVAHKPRAGESTEDKK